MWPLREGFYIYQSFFTKISLNSNLFFFQILTLISAISQMAWLGLFFSSKIFPTTLYHGVVREKDVSLMIQTHLSRLAPLPGTFWGTLYLLCSQRNIICLFVNSQFIDVLGPSYGGYDVNAVYIGTPPQQNSASAGVSYSTQTGYFRSECNQWRSINGVWICFRTFRY